MNFRLWIFALWILGSASLRAAHVQFNLQDFNLSGTLAGSTNKITPRSVPRICAGNLIPNDGKTFIANGSGVFVVSNMCEGVYQHDIRGPGVITTLRFTVPDTNALLLAVDLYSVQTNAANAAEGYSQSAANSRFVHVIQTNGVAITTAGSTLNFSNGANTTVAGSFTGGVSTIQISSTGGGSGSGESNTISSLGVSNTNVKPIAAGKSGVDLRTYSMQAGSNVVLTATATSIVVNASVAALGTLLYDDGAGGGGPLLYDP